MSKASLAHTIDPEHAEHPVHPLRGVQVSVTARRYTQNNREFFVAIIPHGQLKNLAYTEVFTKENEKGDQRHFYPQHAAQFARAIQDRKKRKTRSHSITAGLCNGAFADYDGSADDVTIIFPKPEGKFLRLTDGQHSLGAVREVTKDIQDDWDWLVTILGESSNETLAGSHLDINAFQKSSDKAVTCYQQYLYDLLPPYHQRIGQVFAEVTDDESSLLYGRLKTHHLSSRSPDGRSIGYKQVVDKSVNIMRIEAVRNMSHEDLYKLVRAYYECWKMANEDLWADPTYICSKPTGLNVFTKCMFAVFCACLRRYKKLDEESMFEIISKISKKWDVKKTQQRGRWVGQGVFRMREGDLVKWIQTELSKISPSKKIEVLTQLPEEE